MGSPNVAFLCFVKQLQQEGWGLHLPLLFEGFGCLRAPGGKREEREFFVLKFPVQGAAPRAQVWPSSHPVQVWAQK